jgi:anti-sigma factor RsiW
MIPPDTTLKVQAYVDGELSEAEAGRVAALLSQDRPLAAMAEDLRRVKAILAANEPQLRVPESREFYWSKIAREIQRTTPHAPGPAPLRLSWWLRVVVPVGSVLLLTAVFLVRSQFGAMSPRYLATGHDIETPLTEVESITFRSESSRMTVVWIDTSIN